MVDHEGPHLARLTTSSAVVCYGPRRLAPEPLSPTRDGRTRNGRYSLNNAGEFVVRQLSVVAKRHARIFDLHRASLRALVAGGGGRERNGDIWICGGAKGTAAAHVVAPCRAAGGGVQAVSAIGVRYHKGRERIGIRHHAATGDSAAVAIGDFFLYTYATDNIFNGEVDLKHFIV
ncbi:hypothetical protein EVAR_64147_1 [Eumeta japonica]|uniref:Uncharacterized protein n=1 Tax=Eumeta variegata TaxID=151549 RepID=A0A4C1ZWC2_EUMVA|nr:hypothetical protein EVAR_64147_1 [Eumeta japonica]